MSISANTQKGGRETENRKGEFNMENEAAKTEEQTVDYKAEYEKLKASFDKTSSEVADYKRKERERMSEDEKKQAELAERETYYKALEKENAIHRYSLKFNGIIKEESVLSNVATDLAEGNVEKAIEKIVSYFSKEKKELEKTIKEELMRNNPQANAQSSSGTITKEQFKNMTVGERTKIYNEQPELYKQLTN